ncbi:metallophosphoesterase family protein [Salirhabdus salicampi]|uniref:metallophosphoesterase family protein n=1 Tax=Salirhabdus salicampi TaxID=476102 RepID=UPI0020C1DE59|nr:DNA repair exonuclease [Salirhabdus salicampi]MCP8615493.1 DNA repair exonuclease [Salirhabdus salicampi]
MRTKIKFIHAADLHLDSPFKGLSSVPYKIFDELKDSTFTAFERLIDYAVNYKVDFVLFVGDIFDEQSRNLKAQLKFKRGLEKLHESGIQAFVSYGNHDHLSGEYFQVEYPENTYVFDSERVTVFPYRKNGVHLADIYGFSYGERAVTEGKIHEYIAEKRDILNIGMLHGSISSNSEHDVYAPFRLSDLSQGGMDYWALGHIHTREIINESPLAIYPGNIQGRHIKEMGEKGCYLVEVTEQGQTWSFLQTNTISFEQLTVDATTCTTVDQIEHQIKRAMNTLREDGRCAVVRINLHIERETIGYVNQESIEQLQDYLNEGEADERKWIWIETIKTINKVQWNREQMLQGKHFASELLRTVDEVENSGLFLTELTKHRDVEKFLDPFTKEELEDILTEAEELVMEELLKE